jgi:hypothetical protein
MRGKLFSQKSFPRTLFKKLYENDLVMIFSPSQNSTQPAA